MSQNLRNLMIQCVAVDDLDNCRCSICHNRVKQLIKYKELYLCRYCFDDFKDSHLCADLE